MIHPPITDEFGLSSPILSIGMGWEGLPRLPAAVSNAGGLGFVGASVSSRRHLAEILRINRDLTGRAFGVGMCAPTTGQFHACLTERPAVVAFLDVAPRQVWIDALHRAHIRVWIEAGSPAEGRSAVRHGADAACRAARLLGSAEGGIGRRVVTSERLPRPRIAAFPHARRDDGAGASELIEVLPSPDVITRVEERITGFSGGIRRVAPAICSARLRDRARNQ